MKSSLDLKSVVVIAKKYFRLFMKHVVFATVLAVLVIYLFTVWYINKLAASEPSQEAEDTAIAQTRIPKIDNNAIKNIQALEQSNTEIRALFNNVRNNPFQE